MRLGVASLEEDDLERARALLERAFLPRIKQASDAVLNISTGGSAVMTLDDRLAALAFLRTVDSDSTAYVKSIWAAWYGDVELALSAMRRSDTTYAFWIPLMKDVRRHPGFKDLVRDMNLVEYWREYSWADYCRPVGEEDFECE